MTPKPKRQKNPASLAEKWAPWKGTPETNEAIATSGKTKRQRRYWPLERMHLSGTISDDELIAGQEIAAAVEIIEANVSVRSSSLEARVDNYGSSRDILLERLGRIRLEVAYSRWRKSLPMPKRLVIDMIISNQAYTAVARRHRVPWRVARKHLIKALRHWSTCRADAHAACDRDSLALVYGELGEGQLTAPRSKDDVER